MSRHETFDSVQETALHKELGRREVNGRIAFAMSKVVNKFADKIGITDKDARSGFASLYREEKPGCSAQPDGPNTPHYVFMEHVPDLVEFMSLDVNERRAKGRSVMFASIMARKAKMDAKVQKEVEIEQNDGKRGPGRKMTLESFQAQAEDVEVRLKKLIAEAEAAMNKAALAEDEVRVMIENLMSVEMPEAPESPVEKHAAPIIDEIAGLNDFGRIFLGVSA